MTRKMKDSGIEWIGEIPEDWEISKIKYVSDLNGRIGFRGYKQSDLVEEEHGAITLGPPNMDNGKLNLLNCKYLSWEKYYESPEIQLRVGDILLVKTASVGKVAYVDRLVKEMTINPQLLIIKSKNINNKFLFYVIFSEFFQSQVEMSVTGGTVPTLSQEKISNFEITNPPMTSQIKIAKYLDKMCFEVERISNKIKLEIENLENYKKSVITEAVTKGLDKNVEMKDSGIEWIGEIPKHWEVMKLKYGLIEKMKYGASEEGIEFSEKLPRYIRITDIDQEGNLKATGKLSLSEEKSIGYILEDKTVLFARSGATVGKTFLYKKEYGRSAYAGYLIAAKTNNMILLGKWLYYFTFSNVYYNWTRQIFSQSTIQNINAEKYSNMSLPITNISEQLLVIDYIDKATKSIDEAIQAKQKQLEILEEYKKSLIYEYVTGKKEVKDGEES